ncbi:hypothetical protein [Oryzomonas rubra]|uniref:Uncharacterized protein n=1 Tax=Oryzomonas rubra TaxID=2509454 RepID=A0A5A9XNP4_9BACT|nr:hypothetical protein [Oryzomonas rubra]KAA0893211.1 hypothetical protein ET418_05170 [Oryzomonas rubra]
MRNEPSGKKLPPKSNDRKSQMITNVILAIVAVLSLIISWYTSYTSTNALKLNTKVFDVSYRPYLGIEQIKVSIAQNVLAVDIAYKNFGNVPAKKVTISMNFIGDTNTKNLRPEHEPFLLFPNVYKHYNFVIQDKQNYLDITSGKEPLTFEMTINYEGIDSKKHYTKERQQYNHFTNTFQTMSGDAN